MISLRPILDRNHSNELERLRTALSQGDNSQWCSAVVGGESGICPMTSFVHFLECEADLNLTSLRTLYQKLRSDGYFDAAIEVLYKISERTGKDTDIGAIARLIEDSRLSRGEYEFLDAVIAGAQSHGAIDPAKPTILFAIGAAQIEHEKDRVQAYVNFFGEIGRDAALVLLGDEVDHSNLNVSAVHMLPMLEGSEGGGSAQERYRSLAEQLVKILQLHSVERIHLRAPLREATLIAKVGSLLDIPIIWDPPFDEAALRLAQAQNSFCKDHIPDRYQASADMQLGILQSSKRAILDHFHYHGVNESGLERDPGDVVLTTSPMGHRDVPVQVLVEASTMNTQLTSIVSASVRDVFGDAKQLEVNLIDGTDAQERLLKQHVGANCRVQQISDQAEAQHSLDGHNIYISGELPNTQTWVGVQQRLQHFSRRGYVTVGPELGSSLALGTRRSAWRYRDRESISLALQHAADIGHARMPSEPRSLQDILGEAYAAIEDEGRPQTKKHRTYDSSIFSTVDLDLDVWVSWVRENKYEHTTEWFSAKGQSADEVIREGWRFEEFPLIPLDENTDWINVASSDRTWDFTLNTWEFMDPVIREFVRSGDIALLKWCVSMANLWTSQILSNDTRGTMVWYDMALALRSPRLVSLIHLAAEHELDVAELRSLFTLVQAHVDAHEAEDSFVSGNNHGFYAALGQIVLSQALACIPGTDSLRQLGEERMKIMAEQQFLPDGGHAEHSPDYHRMLLTSFQQAVSLGLITDDSVTTRIEKASEALGWFVQPNGQILQIGDSPGRNMVQGKSRALNEHTQFVTTNGRQGVPPTDELFVMPETGYAIVRSPQVSSTVALSETSYLAFMAGFHSRAHKHCDDLSVVWAHEGREILVDGGRFGYGPQLPKKSPLRDQGFFYASPERQYVESVMAHNTLALDGENHDRRRRPHGSAIQSAVQTPDGFYISGEVPHDSWRHRRSIKFRPGLELVIEDEVTALDDLTHQMNAYFNIDGSLDVTGDLQRGCAISEGNKMLCRLSWSLGERASDPYLDVVRGGIEPLRGWRSVVDRTLEPVTSLCLTATFNNQLTIVTKFDLTS